MISRLLIAGFISVIAVTAAFANGLPGTLFQTAATLAIASTQTAGDRNGNSIPDDEDIAAGTSHDCNLNGVPDECDFIAELTATGTAYTDGGDTPGMIFASFFYVYPPNANDRFVGQVSPTEYALKDVAVDPTDNKIYTVNMPSIGKDDGDYFQHLYLVDPVTGAGTRLPQPTSSESPFPVLGLTFGLDGTLYGFGPAGFVILDKTTGAISQVLNTDVWGYAMATSPTGGIYSLALQSPQTPPDSARSPSGCALLLHDPTNGNIVSSVALEDPTQMGRQIVDIAFGANGQLYGIAGYVYGYPPYYDFYGQTLVIIDPATGLWADVGPFAFSSLYGLGGPRYSASLDCNQNAIPDGCETDCNQNGIPDDCDLAAGTSKDCNGNGIPDECDIGAGTSKDCNGNGIPDECDLAAGTSLDCNGNVIPDECDIAGGASADANQNGIPDECDTPQAAEPPEGQPLLVGPNCVFFLFQSLFGIPLCGPCWLAATFATLVGMGGMKRYVSRRYGRRRSRRSR